MKHEWNKTCYKDSPVYHRAEANIPQLDEEGVQEDKKADIMYNPERMIYEGSYDTDYCMELEKATSLDDAIRLAEEWLAENVVA